MKKNFTKLTAALIAGVWTLGLQAQTDVTSQYLKNADFETAPICFTVAGGETPNAEKLTGIGTDGRDGNVFAVPEWTQKVVMSNNAAQVSTGEYGQTAAVANGQNATMTPAADNAGNGGACLHLSAGWGDKAIITQVAAGLPEGKYALVYNVINQYSKTGIFANYCGTILADGTATYGTLKTAAQGEWLSETVEFNVATTQDVTISLGFTTSSGSSNDGAKLYVDNVKLLYYGIDKTDLNNAIAEATTIYGDGSGVGVSVLKSAIEAAQVVADNAAATMADIEAAKATLADAVKTYNYIIDLNAAIAEATTLYGEGTGNDAAALKSAIDAAQVVVDNTAATMADVEAAKAALADAVKAYNLAQVSPENPMDMTGWITNAVVANGTGWSNYRGNSGEQYDNAPDNTYMDSWNGAGEHQYQVVTGLPEGKYELKAALRGSQDLAGVTVYAIGAEEKSASMTGVSSTGNELGRGWQWVTVTDIVVAADGKLEIGFKCNTDGGAWAGADDFRLTYLGYDNSAAVEALNAQITAAKAVEGKMGTDVKTALDAAIVAAETVAAAPSKDALTKASADLSAAVTAAEASIADYAKLNTAIADAEALFTAWDEKYGTVESLNCGLSEAIEAAKSVYDASTAVVADEVAKLAAAKIAFAKTVKPVDGEPLDFTDLYIVNPEANDGLNGWVKEGDALITRNNEHYSGQTNPYFDTDNWNAASWNVTLTQEITNLPAGDYTVKCVSRASAGVTLTMTLTSGENTASSTGTSVGNTGGELGNGWGKQSADITVGEDGVLKIVFNPSASASANWSSFDEFQLIFNKKAMSPELKAAVANLQELYDEINLFLGELDKEDATYGELYLAWVHEFDSSAAPAIEECLANPTSVDEVESWIGILKQWYEPKTTTILLIECEELYASYENPSDEAGFAKAISEVKNFDDLYGTPAEYAQLIEDLKAAREAFIYENMATETYLFAWGNATVGSIEGTEVNNRLVGNAGDTAEGLILELTGNTGKAYSAANKINVPLPDGTTGERTTIKLSNGAQNTLYLPKGKIATKITFYSYINLVEYNSDDKVNSRQEQKEQNKNNESGEGYRFSYWKEVAGTTYTAETATLMNIFVDGVRQEDNSVVTEGYVAGSCDAISFPLNGVKDVITFTNTGEQACFIIAVELADDPAIAALKKAIADAEAYVATLNAEDVNEASVIEMLNPEIEYSKELLADLSDTTMEDIQTQADNLNFAVAMGKEMLEKQAVADEVKALIAEAQEIYYSIDETVRTDEAGLLSAIQNADMASMNIRWATLEGLQAAKVALETALEAFKVENKYVDPEMKAALAELETAVGVAKEFAASITNPEASATHYEAYNMAMSMVAAGEAYIADPSTATLAGVQSLTAAINEQIPLYKGLLEAADAKLAAIAEAQTAVEAAEATYAKYENPVDNAGLAGAIADVKGIIDELANPWGMSTVEDLTAAVTKMKEAEAAFIAENALVGIDNVEAGKEVVAVKYFTLNGVELTEPVEGVIVKKTLYADGTVTTVKMVVKK